MAQDTRKDPRAKVLTMTVRYKSATLDEFIEHHSYDISRGGMFIKTPSPFPPGTLLKFEVKIAEDQKLMQGVGRVVWKREAPDAGNERPAGMGVKFIKIDEQSKKLIDQLVVGRGDGTAAFEQGEIGASAPQVSKAPMAPLATKPVESDQTRPAMRKATMIGLGAMAQAAADAAAAKAAQAQAAPEQPDFFPKPEAGREMPAPEDRTVMKQAAELLEDALREAGGSLDEVGDTSKPKEPEEDAETKPAPVVTSKPPLDMDDEPTQAMESRARIAEEPEPKSEPKPEPKPEPEPKRAVAREPVRARPSASERPPRALSSPPEDTGGGGGKAIALLLGVAAAAGLVFFLTREKPSEPAPEPPVPTEPVAQEPTPPPEPVATAPVPVEQPPPAPPVADAVDAGLDAKAQATEKPTKAELKPKPEIRPQPRPQPRPKPKPEVEASEEPGPAPEPKPPVEPKPKPEPKPKATPKPAPDTDNPY